MTNLQLFKKIQMPYLKLRPKNPQVFINVCDCSHYMPEFLYIKMYMYYV